MYSTFNITFRNIILTLHLKVGGCLGRPFMFALLVPSILYTGVFNLMFAINFKWLTSCREHHLQW